ncbi:MAG: acetyltransferase [Streptococcaceae bacterium]|nr:acetyltransferase [Streptococcaceae bacterium]
MKRYVSGLNGLRTLAVLGVILYHLYPNVVQGGFLGVVLFFVLSGYLVTDSLLVQYDQTQHLDVLGFWKKRVKRLYPLMLTVFLVVSPYLFFFQNTLRQGLKDNFISSIFLVQNWWQIQQGSSYFANAAGESPFKHLYYLSIEGQFFLIWPLVLFLLVRFVRNKGQKFLIINLFVLISVVLMMVFYQPGTDPTRVYYGTDTRVFSLLMGAGLAVIWPLQGLSQKISQKGKQLGQRIFIGILALLVIFYFILPAQSSITYYGGLWFASLLSMIAIAFIVHPTLGINEWLSNKIFDYIGSRAYGIYLWQLPVFALTAAKLTRATSWYNVIWEIALIIGLAELSYRFVEQPIQKFDFSNFWQRMVQYFKKDAKEIRTIPLYIGIIFILFSGILILASPPSPRDQKMIEAKILAQQQALLAKQKNEANAKAPAPIKTIAAKYGIEPRIADKASQLKLLGIGDSVMIAGSTDLQEVFSNTKTYIDADIGRQTDAGAARLQELSDKAKNADVILIGLGTNGVIEDKDIATIMKASQGKPVYWINNHVSSRPWQDSNNATLQNAAKKYSNLKIIDWNDLAKNHPEWFYSDDIHPQGEGAIKYVQLIVTSMIP